MPKEIGDLNKEQDGGGGDASVSLWGALAALTQGTVVGGLESAKRDTAALAVDAASIGLALASNYLTDNEIVKKVGAGLGYSALGSMGRRYGGPMLGFLIPDAKPTPLPASASLAHAANPPSGNYNSTNTNKPPAQEG